jgi:hypothetical protein
MVNQSKPPLPPNMPYHQPLNYPKYVKYSNLDVHVKVFKVVEMKHFCNQNQLCITKSKRILTILM